jgi:hypothetical protein
MIPAKALDFMSKPIELDAEAPADAAANSEGSSPGEPQVFVRTLAAPPGWPWEQRRGAELETRHGAPLPLSELLYRIRRLEPWRPGAPARFAAFYVLARDVDDQLEASAEVDGRQIAVTFGRVRGQSLRAGRLGLTAVAGAAVLLVVVSAIGTGLSKRTETAAALATAEQRTETKLRRLQARERQAEEERLLRLQLERGVALREVVKDLAWVSAEKAPDVGIEALHWREGLMALEVRGKQAPFEFSDERRVERAKRPIRKGVWLWGVGAKPGGAPTGMFRAERP